MNIREDLDMATIVDGAITAYLQDRTMTGAAPFEMLSPVEKNRMRQVFLPVIWSALPSILAQLNEPPFTAEESPEDILAGFQVPDSLEGLVQ